jgi:hypothetical protein
VSAVVHHISRDDQTEIRDVEDADVGTVTVANLDLHEIVSF